MIITIYEGFDKSYIMLGSKNEEFHKAWGNVIKIPVSAMYRDLSQIANWCNNTIGEECLFEMD